MLHTFMQESMFIHTLHSTLGYGADLLRTTGQILTDSHPQGELGCNPTPGETRFEFVMLTLKQQAETQSPPKSDHIPWGLV